MSAPRPLDPRVLVAGQDIPNDSLNRVLSTDLQRIANTTTSWSGSGCLLADIAEFTSRATNLISELAQNAANGQHVSRYVQRRMKEMDENHDFSQMNEIDYLDEQHANLREIARRMQQCKEEVEDLVQSGRKPPFSPMPLPISATSVPQSHPMNRSSGYVFEDEAGPSRVQDWSAFQYTELDTIAGASRPSVYPPSHTQVARSTDQDMLEDLLSQVANRGRGNHTCPLGIRCNKGGVKDNQVKVFEHNSSFKEHLQKHVKPFKCELPGCTNNRGFAREDQLRRHQEESCASRTAG